MHYFVAAPENRFAPNILDIATTPFLHVPKTRDWNIFVL